MQNFIHNIADFFTPKAVHIIKAKNDCGEVRYIEVPYEPTRERRESTYERRENLDRLLMKTRRLLSFVMSRFGETDDSKQIIQLIDKIKQSMYKNDTTTHLFSEFEQFESKIKKSSKSVMNLSDIHWG